MEKFFNVFPFLIFIFITIYLFIICFSGSLSLHMSFSQECQVGATLWLQCTGFSLRRLLLLRSVGSRAPVSVLVVHGLSYSTACGIFLDQGLNPCAFALAGWFLTSGPPGRSWKHWLLFWPHDRGPLEGGQKAWTVLNRVLSQLTQAVWPWASAFTALNLYHRLGVESWAHPAADYTHNGHCSPSGGSAQLPLGLLQSRRPEKRPPPRARQNQGLSWVSETLCLSLCFLTLPHLAPSRW